VTRGSRARASAPVVRRPCAEGLGDISGADRRGRRGALLRRSGRLAETCF
jgi:hypothetical protein